MPLYEYKCDKCGLKTTLLRKLSQRDNPVVCECGGSATKILSASSFHLKGGGWASTGYADSPSVDGYNGCNTRRKRMQRAAELGDEKPAK